MQETESEIWDIWYQSGNDDVDEKMMQAAEMGVSSSDLGFAANALIDGAYVSDYYLDNKKIDLVVMGEHQFATPLFYQPGGL